MRRLVLLTNFAHLWLMKMCKWLTFQLHGPMASWGDIAVGTIRPSWNHPTRSAIIGLLSAALGIRRDDEEMLLRISQGYRMAFRVVDSGSLIRDYHTIHSTKPRSKKQARVYHTRKDALESLDNEIETTLSSRDYLCDSYYIVFMTESDTPPFSLEELEKYLREPVFTLYLGRKSCPLALPLNPLIIEAETLEDVCKSYSLDSVCKSYFLDSKLKKRTSPKFQIFWEEGIKAGDGVRELQSEFRRDQLVSRKRWQYSDRKEHRGFVEGG